MQCLHLHAVINTVWSVRAARNMRTHAVVFTVLHTVIYTVVIFTVLHCYMLYPLFYTLVYTQFKVRACQGIDRPAQEYAARVGVFEEGQDWLGDLAAPEESRTHSICSKRTHSICSKRTHSSPCTGFEEGQDWPGDLEAPVHVVRVSIYRYV